MYLEERIEKLEKIISKQQEEIKFLQAQGNERFYSPKEFAKKTGCSEQLVYRQIQSGEIKTLRGLGSKKVIPMSQFYERVQEENEYPEYQKSEKKKYGSIKEAIFA